MKPETPHLTDYMRILMGDVPWSFLLEASLRLVILYIILLAGLRLMGKRMAGQLSRTELAALVALAAGIGIPILSPDRGLVEALVIAAVVVLMQQGMVRWAARRPTVEHLLQDNQTTVAANQTNRI
ncbi:MAG: hypothetical protein WKG07_04675 [Hymenobacter sp.]